MKQTDIPDLPQSCAPPAQGTDEFSSTAWRHTVQQHSENEWTAGPWEVSGVRHSGDLKIGQDARLHAVGPDGDAVAMVFYNMKTGRGWLDAQLIAAAPDLAVAAQKVIAWWDSTLATNLLSHKDFPWAEDAEWDQFADLRAALAKALSK